MLKKILYLPLVVVTLSFGDIGLRSGSDTGTYRKIANDIQAIMKKEGIKIKVYRGDNLGNIKGVLKDKRYQFAIVQSDALSYYDREVYQKKNEEKAKRIKSKSKRKAILAEKLSDEIKMIFPLYNEEIHIIVNKKSGINTVADLDGKIVNLSTTGSWVTGQNIKNEIGIEWKEDREKNRTIVMDRLINGEIDAIIYISGKPTSSFDYNKGISKYIKLIPYKSDLYTPTTISSKDYDWVEGEVPSSAVKAILVTYNYTKERAKKHPRFNEYIENIRNISKIVNKYLPFLREHRHKKWKEINPLDYKSVNWPLADVIKNNKRVDINQFSKKKDKKIDINQFKKRE